MNQPEQTLAAAQQAVASNPNDDAQHIQLGMAYFEAGRFDEATAAFHHALLLNPHSAAAYNGIGRVRYHTGPPTAAIAAYEQAIALDPHYIDPVYGLGILYSAQLGDYEQAVAAFAQGLRHNPENAFLTAMMPGGMAWQHYRVRFENGVELGLLDRKKLSLVPLPA